MIQSKPLTAWSEQACRIIFVQEVSLLPSFLWLNTTLHILGKYLKWSVCHSFNLESFVLCKVQTLFLTKNLYNSTAHQVTPPFELGETEFDHYKTWIFRPLHPMYYQLQYSGFGIFTNQSNLTDCMNNDDLSCYLSWPKIILASMVVFISWG